MTQENEIKRPTQDLEHEPIKQLDNSEISCLCNST